MGILEEIVAPSIYCILSVFGTIGNGLVLYIMMVVVKTKSVTDVYVTNLAVADFLFVATLPFWANELFSGNWIFGDAMCKILSGLSYINMYASIFFLTAMSVDRWLAVVQAIKARKVRTVRRTWIISGIVWLVCLLFMVFPLSFRNDLPFGKNRRCMWNFPDRFLIHMNVTYMMSRVVVGFIIPLSIVVFCYASIISFMRKRSRVKKKKYKGLDKVTKMVTMIIICFVLAWLPNQITNMMHLFGYLGVFHYCGSSHTPTYNNTAVGQENVTFPEKIQPMNKSVPTLHAPHMTSLQNITELDSFVRNLSSYLETSEKIEDLTLQAKVETSFATTTVNLYNLNPISDTRTIDPNALFILSTSLPQKESDEPREEDPVMLCYRTVRMIHMITVCLGFANSMINPFVYAFVGSALRKKMKLAFQRFKPNVGNKLVTMHRAMTLTRSTRMINSFRRTSESFVARQASIKLKPRVQAHTVPPNNATRNLVVTAQYHRDSDGVSTSPSTMGKLLLTTTCVSSAEKVGHADKASEHGTLLGTSIANQSNTNSQQSSSNVILHSQRINSEPIDEDEGSEDEELSCERNELFGGVWIG